MTSSDFGKEADLLRIECERLCQVMLQLELQYLHRLTDKPARAERREKRKENAQ